MRDNEFQAHGSLPSLLRTTSWRSERKRPPSHLRPVDRHPRRCPEPPLALAQHDLPHRPAGHALDVGVAQFGLLPSMMLSGFMFPFQ